MFENTLRKTSDAELVPRQETYLAYRRCVEYAPSPPRPRPPSSGNSSSGGTCTCPSGWKLYSSTSDPDPLTGQTTTSWMCIPDYIPDNWAEDPNYGGVPTKTPGSYAC